MDALREQRKRWLSGADDESPAEGVPVEDDALAEAFDRFGDWCTERFLDRFLRAERGEYPPWPPVQNEEQRDGD